MEREGGPAPPTPDNIAAVVELYPVGERSFQGQLRLAPSGQVSGVDMQAALQLAVARSYGLSVLSELLPAAEAGVVEALCQRGAT